MTSDKDLCAPEQHTALVHAKPPTKAQRCGRPTAKPWQTCTKQEIKQYRKYNVLYGERKFARSFEDQKQTLSFTEDLPAEIRLSIYGYLFKTPEYFELWAPWNLTKKGSRCQNQFNTYASSKKALRIMRLSKKIHEEVAEYFYGRQNIRFSTFNGFQAMTVFNHTLGRGNCDFIKHITVQIPNREWRVGGAYACMWYIAEWNAFQQIQERRGLRVPDFGFRMRHYDQGRVRGEYNYEKAVPRGFRQLRNMASLETLEVLIPWDYEFTYGSPPTFTCRCLLEDMQELGPRDCVRHYVEEHSSNPEYWALLADLKQQTASENLTIALVIVHEPSGEIRSKDRHFLRQGRWLAAYASVMGYRIGHTKWEDNGTYVVRYDKDEMLSVSPEEDEEEDALLEPPELPV